MNFFMVLITDPVQKKKTEKNRYGGFILIAIFSKVVVVTYFAIFHLINNLVSSITSKRIKLECWDWAHFKGLFKSFPNVAKFM